MARPRDDIHPDSAAAGVAAQGLRRVLIVEPDEDVRELLVERCRRLGLDPVAQGVDEEGRLPEVDLIVAEPASQEAQEVLSAHGAQQSGVPIVFVSIYPPASGVLRSPAVAYLVLPCSSEELERALSKALTRGPGGR
jgi:CheY-like chemotaxis protein